MAKMDNKEVMEPKERGELQDQLVLQDVKEEGDQQDQQEHEDQQEQQEQMVRIMLN